MDWPHAPAHRLEEGATYIVTSGTYLKEHRFRGSERLTLLRDALLELAISYGYSLEAWAVFSNHYHIIVRVPEQGAPLSRFLGHLHSRTSSAVNELDDQRGRKVWFQYWDTLLTFEKSYLARLNYVHNNPVKHGLVRNATEYEWCSAAWFERTAAPAFYRTISALKTDTVKVRDDFEPE